MKTPPPAAEPPDPAVRVPSPPSVWDAFRVPVIFAATIFLMQLLSAPPSPPTIGYTQFYALVEAGQVKRVTLTGDVVSGTLGAAMLLDTRPVSVTSAAFRALLPPREDRDLLPLLRGKRVDVIVQSDEPSLGSRILSGVLPWVLILGAWVWFSSRTQRAMSGGPLGAFFKGRTHRFESETQVPVKLDDVAGLAAAKRDLREIVDFLKDPAGIRRLGGKVPHGVLLYGPPGTGKTLLARAVAGEAGVPFFSISASEFIELFVGMGASRVRELFAEAKKVAPAIIFIDEIDAIGRSRGTGLGGGNDEREQTLNQLLSEMDGFTRNDHTIVLAATNRPDVLDSALLRPGRFDRRVVIDRPEVTARQAILEVHTRGKPLGADVDLRALAALTPGFSGADLANLANEAALQAARRGVEVIAAQDFHAAYDKIVLGDPRETKLDPTEKRRVAVHESGHAILAHFTPGAEPLERVSIIPRGMALGVTQQSPGTEKHIITQPEFEARLSVLMGGYAAELVVTGVVSSGARDDLQKATELAFQMVAHYGMSERVGPMFFDRNTEHPFLGRTLAVEGAASEGAIRMLEEESARLLSAALAAAKKTVADQRAALDRFTAALVERETIERDDLAALVAGPADIRLA